MCALARTEWLSQTKLFKHLLPTPKFNIGNHRRRCTCARGRGGCRQLGRSPEGPRCGAGRGLPRQGGRRGGPRGRALGRGLGGSVGRQRWGGRRGGSSRWVGGGRQCPPIARCGPADESVLVAVVRGGAGGGRRGIYGTIHYDTIYDTILYNTIRYYTIQYDTVRYDTIQFPGPHGPGPKQVRAQTFPG